MMEFKKTVLDNGLRVVTAPQRDNPSVTVLVLVEVGSKYEEKDINGISHFLEHMCFKGTTKRPRAIEISTELDSLGASYNAFTSFEWTGYYAKVDKSHFDKALDVVSDIYLNQIFDPKEIEKEKGVIIEEINMYEDLPTRRVMENFTNLLYGDQPAGWDIGGRKEVIRALTQKDFTEYRKDHYVAGATAVLVAGAIDEGEVVEKVKKSFAGISEEAKKGKLPVKESQGKPELLVKFKETDQTHMVLGVRTYRANDDRRYALEVLIDVLGGGMSSRLFEKIRNELGAAYYTKADSDLLSDHGFLTASAGADNKRSLDVMGAIIEEFRRLKREPVGAKELEKAKDHLVGGLMLGLETSDALAWFYGEQELLTRKPVTPDEIAKKIKAVSAEDIREVANDIFQNKKLNLSVIGPIKDASALQEVLKID